MWGSTLLQYFAWCGNRSAVALLLKHRSVFFLFGIDFVFVIISLVVIDFGNRFASPPWVCLLCLCYRLCLCHRFSRWKQICCCLASPVCFSIVVVIGNILSLKVQSNDKSRSQTFFTKFQNVASLFGVDRLFFKF